MPAGAALAPRAFPPGFAGLGGLPEGEVQRIFLFLAGGHARARLKLVQAAARQLAVGRIAAHAEIDVARGGGVGLAVADERRADILHGLDIFGGAGLLVGADDAEGVHVFMEGVDIGFGDGLPVAAFLVGPADDLVVHVRKVAYERHFKAGRAQMAHQNVKDQRRTGVPDMAVVVGRDAADVESDMAGANGNKGLFFAGQGVVELHGFAVLSGSGVGRKLIQTALVAAAFKFGGKEGVHNGKGEHVAGHAGPQTEHVGVVVLSRQPGVQFRGAERRANARMAVGGHGHADARAADQDAPAIFLLHGGAQGVRKDRIVAAGLAVGTEIDDFVALPGKVAADGGLERHAGMIRGDMQTLIHDCRPLRVF